MQEYTNFTNILEDKITCICIKAGQTSLESIIITLNVELN